MLTNRNRKLNRRRGAAIVEGALTLLITICMITFVMDMGQILMFLQFFGERSRAAARYATVNSYDTNAIKNYIAYNTTQPTNSQAEGAGLMGLKPSMVTVNRYDSGLASDRIEITITNYPLYFYTPLLAGAYSHKPARIVIPVESLGDTD